MKPVRCQWCIDGDHAGCVVVLQFGSPKLGRPEKHKGTYYHQRVAPYLWRCGCDCEWATGTKCLKCGQVRVEVDADNRCADQVRCFEVRSLTLKLSDPEGTIAS